MLAAFLSVLLASTAARAAPFARRGLSAVIEQCKHDFAYTWDDGPYDWHQDILNEFSAVGGKTTFFMNGNNWECIYDQANVDRIRASFEAGHQIAHHTWSHASLISLTDAEIDEEIQRLDEAFVKIIGVKPKILRPPYGDINEHSASYIQTKYGKTIVLWSDDSGDSVGGTEASSYAFYLALAAESPKKPHMTLSHEVLEIAIDAMKQGTVTALHNAGINLVTVAQCLDQDAYEYIGGYGTRDSTWTCDGAWTPGNPTNPTTTTSTAGPAPTCRETYTAVAGDTCASIGSKYGLTANQILAANTFLNCNDIWAWTPICVPNGGSTPSSTTPSQPAPSCVSTYTAGVGDTCASIGSQYGLTANQIQAANTFLNCQDIWQWTPICIPPGGSSNPPPTNPTCVSTYTSGPGDTCASIGSKYGLTANQILNANSFLNCQDIWTNTPICIPPGGSGNGNTCSPQTYTAVQGDTCQKIATKFGVTANQVKQWNDFVNCDDIWAWTPIAINC